MEGGHIVSRVAFIVPNGQEAKMFQAIEEELIKRGVEVINIETGALCCERNAGLPSATLKELGMKHASLKGYKSMAKILKEQHADALVVGSDQEYIHRAFVYAAQGLGIPAVLMDINFGSNEPKGHWLVARRSLYRLSSHFVNLLRKYAYTLRTVVDLKWSIGRIAKMVISDVVMAFTVEHAIGMYGCDAIAVAGTWERDVLLERGVKPETIYIAGNPAMSLPSKGEDAKIGGLRRELGIGEEDKVILLLTCAQVEHGRWSQSMRRTFVNALLDVLSPLSADSAKLVIKIHPVENLDEYRGILRDRREDVILCKDLPSVDAIGMSDVVLVGGYSFTVLEAGSLGKPVVLLNMFNEVKNLPYEEMGLAVCLYKYGDVEPTIRSLLYDHSARDRVLEQIKLFYEDNKEFADGKASERIADLIADMARKHKEAIYA